MDNIRPPKQLMENTYVWLAHELVSQHKNGNFKSDMELQGIDGSNRRFKIKVKPEDIDDSWNFEAELIADFPQDEMANFGMAIQAHEAELLADETIRDRLLHVEDTDLEQRKLDREKVYKVGAIQMRRFAAALKANGDDEGARYILDAIEDMQMQRERGVASQPGTTSPVRPSGTTTAATPQPPQASGLRRFLSRHGAGG
jgi:hypothetical protein